MTRTVASQRFRQRKLSTRVPLQVVREDQLDSIDTDQQNAPKVETGVEKHEETEHHLQAAISASHAAAVGGKVAQIYIPTPETVHSSIPYDQLYQLKFSQPATYIRFSSTVEDCSGCPYNLSEEDDKYLRELNEQPSNKKHASTQCSEDQFEEAMYVFEATAKAQQPFSSVGDPPPVLSLEEMQLAVDENIQESARMFAKDIYEHWKAQRLKNGNTPLQPGLKLKVIETATDADDNDPYVCFRRREVRQVRKTRGRDAQSVEKLKKLRKELEEARQLVALVRQREALKRDSLVVDRQLFERRTSLRQLKRSLPEPYKEGDDELLINQKPQKKKVLEVTNAQRAPAPQLRLPMRADGRNSEADLVSLQDTLAEKENEIEREIKLKIHQHQKWNENYVDMTRAPLTPPLEDHFNSSFRPAVAEYLPTPPASVASDHSGDPDGIEGSPGRKRDSVSVRYASPSPDASSRSQLAFRRRFGRGGRLMIDRRGLKLQIHETINGTVADRFKFDQDEDDEDIITYPVDPYDIASMRYRAAIAGAHQPHAQAQALLRRAQLEGAVNNAQHTGSNAGPPSGPRNLQSG